MKKMLSLCLCLFLGGCFTGGLIKKSAPPGMLPPDKTVFMRGAVQERGLYFSCVTYFDGQSVRVVVLSEIGPKLLDLGVFKDRTEVYYRSSGVPAAFAAAFGRLARKRLLTDTPSKEIHYKDTKTNLNFALYGAE